MSMPMITSMTIANMMSMCGHSIECNYYFWVIKDTLIEIDKEDESYYNENYNNYVEN